MRPRRRVPGSRKPTQPPANERVIAEATGEVRSLLERTAAHEDDPAAERLGPPLDRRAPFLIGLLAVLGGALGIGIVMVLLALSSIFLHVVIALFLALGVEPIVAWLVRAGLSRGRAVLVVLIGVTLVAALLVWLILPPVIEQVGLLLERTPDYLRDLERSSWVQELNKRWDITDRVLDNVESGIDQGTVLSIFGGILGAGKAVADGALAVFTVVFLTVYFVAAMPKVKTAVYLAVPRSRRTRVVTLTEDISTRVGRYLLGQLAVAVVNAVFSYVILLVLGLPYPVVLAVTIGVLALVPILGTIVGAIIITLVALSAGWVSAVIVLGYYVAYHLLETYVISPRIMSRAVDIPPVVTIVAVLAGGALLGVVGALLAIPVAAALSVLYTQVLVPRQQRS